MNLALFKSSGFAVLLVVAGFALAYQFVEPAPPKELTLATGSPTGAYHAFGVSMREVLGRDDIELILHNSAGSAENARLLADGTVDVAMIQGGTPIPTSSDGEQLRALASLYYEPVWIFHRLNPSPVRITELAGQRVNRGEEGSGTRGLVDELLALNKVDGEGFTESDNATAIEALLAGELDALFLVAGEKSPEVQALLSEPEITLMDLPRADAYHLHRRYLSSLTLPAGAIDLAAERPPAQVHLVGVTAMLAAREELHPALVDLLLMSVSEIAGGAGLFHSTGQFPTNKFLSLPLDEDAERFHQRGPSILQRFLPFWAATLVDRLVVMLIPLAMLILPIFKLFPPIYRWQVRSRIYRWYADLGRIEARLDADDAAPDLTEAVQRLEAEVKQVETPLSYADELYHLRSHIELVRTRIKQKDAATSFMGTASAHEDPANRQ